MTQPKTFTTATREWCVQCRKAKATCYCAELKPFESNPRFVILVHPREQKNSVGTARMLHLSIPNSLLIDGADFTHDIRVNRLLADASLHCVLLYPGHKALDLSHCSLEEARRFTPPGKQLVLFIVDGTWDHARGMVNRSANLKALPQLRFTPTRQSTYEIREQPAEHCLSTLESAHWIIERFAELGLYPRPAGDIHNGLLRVFGYMVRQQVDYAAKSLGPRTMGNRCPNQRPLPASALKK